jgi:non-ribosomal peptide synthetase component F
LTEIEWLRDNDINDLWTWNATMPDAIDLPMHDLLSPVFQKQPEAQAICAWDRVLTYEELDRFSNRLVSHLLIQTAGDSSTVPIFIKKSRWVPVAMLAVMKAGLTSCLLDSILPFSRLESIVR